MSRGTRAAIAAWLVTAFYYFFQYTLRSAPAVMMTELSTAFDLTALGVASLVGLFYYGYSPFSLVAGVAMDRLGPRMVVPLGAAVVGVGALLFATGNSQMASAGRFLQGAGGVFALIGAAYIATTNFPPSRAATLIGLTQMFGMAGGSAGQFVVGPLIASGVSWQAFWAAMGAGGLLIGAALWMLLPQQTLADRQRGGSGLFLLSLLLMIATLAGWVVWLGGGLRGPAGEPLYWLGLLLLVSVIFFARQLRG